MQFGSKFEFTKMKIKKNILGFFFLKYSLNTRAVTPTFELDENKVATFVKFEYECGSSKTEGVFEKEKRKSHFIFAK